MSKKLEPDAQACEQELPDKQYKSEQHKSKEQHKSDVQHDSDDSTTKAGIDLAKKRNHKSIPHRAAVGDPTQLYLSEIGFSPLLSAEEEVHFARLALKGNKAAFSRMIESNLRLVVKIARNDNIR